MFGFKKVANNACPARKRRCPAASSRSAPRPSTSSITTRSRAPIRRAARRRCSASAASGAPRSVLAAGDGVYVTAVGYAGGLTPNPTYEEVCSGRTGHNEVVLVVFDPKKISYETLLKTFWESHDPTQGMRQGNDVGTQYRSGIYTFSPAQSKAAEASKAMYEKELAKKRFGAHHHRDRRCPAVLLRRGLSPAVPGQEPVRLLRARRHRRVLPDRHRRQAGPAGVTPLITSPRKRGEGAAGAG